MELLSPTGAEAVMLVAQAHVSDEVYADTKMHFTDEEPVILTAIIGAINVWNRIAIAFRNAPPARVAV